MTTPHPARYTPTLIPVLGLCVTGASVVLDVFSGTGRVGWLRPWLADDAQIIANELEPEWADQATANGCNRVIVGDARALPLADGSVDAVVTSPAYGNRMADHCNWKPGRRHYTYKGHLGRDLTDGNAGRLFWGDDYRALHRDAWQECWRVIRVGGRLVVNVSDFIKAGAVVPVSAWHLETIEGIGFRLLHHLQVQTPRQRHGANGSARVTHENVFVFFRR